ncbi:hypothetical protein diail_10202 [Diaporthe ilicicola]|nr:hypothetical protein diail_10202 [Diaporthe ilicicola]
MAARLLSSGARALRSTGSIARRSFQTSAPRLYAEAAPLPASKPMGAFRGGSVAITWPCWRQWQQDHVLILRANRLFGFLLGATLAGSGTYYYVLQDYKASNELLQDDIYVRSLTPICMSTQALQAATQRMSNYLTTLEEKIDTIEKKKK